MSVGERKWRLNGWRDHKSLPWKSEAVRYAKVDLSIKDIGRRLEKLGAVLKNTVAGGEYHDLLIPLGQSGVDVSKIKELLEERNRLMCEISSCKEELTKLGIA